jgi:GAG-pre-integrase domain
LISNKDKSIFGQGYWLNGSYVLRSKIPYDNKVYMINKNINILIHQRLSHISNDYISKTLEHVKGLENVKINNISDIINCESYIQGKQHKNIN